MDAAVGELELKKIGMHDFLVIPFSGCNFRCPWCNTPDLIETKEEQVTDLRDIKASMTEHKPDAILFTGGEPCLHRPQLMDIAAFAKKKSIKVALHTNGSKPGCIISLLRADLLDSITLDLKAPMDERSFQKITRSKTFFIQPHTIIEDIRQTIDVLKQYDLNITVSTTIIPGLVYRKEHLIKIAEEIDDLDCRWDLVPFAPGNTLSRSFSDIKPPSAGFVEDLKDAILRSNPNIRFEKHD